MPLLTVGRAKIAAVVTFLYSVYYDHSIILHSFVSCCAVFLLSRYFSSRGTFYKGKRVWITGASSGIGESMLKLLVEEGAVVIATARRIEELKRVANEAAAIVAAKAPPSERESAHEQALGRIGILPVDLVALAEDAKNGGTGAHRLVAEAESLAGGMIDVMINNAGVSCRSAIHLCDDSVFHKMMDVNYYPIVAITRALLPGWMSARRGLFINVSSIAGLFGSPIRSAYSASKGALNNFSQALRAEMHPFGIQVHVGHPSYINTPITLASVRGDGTTVGAQDRAHANAMSSIDCADQILDSAAAGDHTSYIGSGLPMLGRYMARLSPDLLDMMMVHIKSNQEIGGAQDKYNQKLVEKERSRREKALEEAKKKTK